MEFMLGWQWYNVRLPLPSKQSDLLYLLLLLLCEQPLISFTAFSQSSFARSNLGFPCFPVNKRGMQLDLEPCFQIEGKLFRQFGRFRTRYQTEASGRSLPAKRENAIATRRFGQAFSPDGGSPSSLWNEQRLGKVRRVQAYQARGGLVCQHH